jgi:hypothetical protein
MKTVCLWRRRFVEKGLPGLEKDAPRGGRPAPEAAALAAKIVKKTTTETPAAATQGLERRNLFRIL